MVSDTFFVQQEMAAPELQRLALEAKGAAAILKYLPATAELLPQVVETLAALSAHQLWPARAAALVFVQVSMLLKARFEQHCKQCNTFFLKSPYYVLCTCNLVHANNSHTAYNLQCHMLLTLQAKISNIFLCNALDKTPLQAQLFLT